MKCAECGNQFLRKPRSRALCCTPGCARRRHLKQQAAQRAGVTPPPSRIDASVAPIPMLLWCPECRARHIDEFETKIHNTHECQTCGNVWRPTIVATVGVRFLPGFKTGGVL